VFGEARRPGGGGEEAGPQAGGERAASGLEDLALAAVHEGRFHRVPVVVPHEVQDAVRHQEVHFQGAGHAQVAGLAGRGLGRDDDLADEATGRRRHLQGKGQHVGAARHAAMGAVETADLPVVDDGHVHGSPRPPRRGQRASRRVGQPAPVNGNPALAVVDGDGHQGGGAPSRGAASRAS
jgi:hypothetical protein